MLKEQPVVIVSGTEPSCSDLTANIPSIFEHCNEELVERFSYLLYFLLLTQLIYKRTIVQIFRLCPFPKGVAYLHCAFYKKNWRYVGLCSR